MASYPVKVYIYDLSKGLARSLSMGFLGKQIDGIWHTAIVVYGEEFFYGGSAIESCPPCGTILGSPDKIGDLGETQIPKEVFMDYLQELSTSTYRGSCYHLLEHNCNNFSSEVAQFLTGKDIPSYITSLPSDVLQTPFGAMIKPFIDSMTVTPTGGHHQLFTEQTSTAGSGSTPTGTGATAGAATTGQTSNDINKPITFHGKKVLTEYNTIKDQLSALVSSVDLALLNDVHEYLSTEDAQWSLSKEHIRTLYDLIEQQREPACCCMGLNLLRLAVLTPGVLHVIKADKQHTLMSLVHNSNTMTQQQQILMLRVLCNCCNSDVGRSWLLSDAVWPEAQAEMCNRRVVMKTCISNLLQEATEHHLTASLLAFNLSTLKFSSDDGVELGSAVMELLLRQPHPTEDILYHLVSALDNLTVNNKQLCELASVMGVNWNHIDSMSDRTKQRSSSIQKRLTST